MSSRTPLLIAIDGPAASGKGSIARKIAAKYGLKHLDTGKLYRTVALMLMRQKFAPDNEKAAVEAAKHVEITLFSDPEITSESVGHGASVVSAIPAVRRALLMFQRDFADNPEGAVLDGRDIGTVICPAAPFKFFITASLPARAERRYKELQSLGQSVTYERILQDLRARDTRDQAREIAPLIPADDAITIDTTGMNIDDAVQTVVRYIEAKN